MASDRFGNEVRFNDVLRVPEAAFFRRHANPYLYKFRWAIVLFADHKRDRIRVLTEDNTVLNCDSNCCHLTRFSDVPIGVRKDLHLLRSMVQ